MKLGMLTLLESVIQKYFEGTKMSWWTFIEQFVALLVRMEETAQRCRYLIETNRRQGMRMV